MCHTHNTAFCLSKSSFLFHFSGLDSAIQILSGKLAEAEAEEKEYDRLVEEQATLKDQIRELMQELND